MADQVLYSGVACITDLMVREGLINLDFADVRAIMRDMGKAMMGTGEASGDRRAILAAEAAIANPLLDEVSMKGAKGLLISITGGNDLTLYEVDEAASRIRQEVDEDANIILGATFDSSLEGIIRVSVVATGIDKPAGVVDMNDQRLAEARRAHARPGGGGPSGRNQSRPCASGGSCACGRSLFRPARAAARSRRLRPPRARPAPIYAPQGYAPQAPQAYPAPRALKRRRPMRRIMPMCTSSACSRRPITSRRPRRSAASRRPLQSAFVPPAAEQPLRAQQRMPSIEEFPEHAQALMRNRQPQTVAEAPAAETTPPHPARASRHLRHEPGRGTCGGAPASAPRSAAAARRPAPIRRASPARRRCMPNTPSVLRRSARQRLSTRMAAP